jgi:hypothetical protein
VPAFAPTNLAVYVCCHIFSSARPVLLIVNDGGEWMFLCGGSDHAPDELPQVVGVGHLTDRDPSLNKCADLPMGFQAERASLAALWNRTESRAAF